jgi:hypothetical protein
MKYFLVGFLLLLSSGLYAADYFPPPFTTVYKVYVKGLPVGEGTRSLTTLPGNQFLFESIAQTTGFLSLFKELRIEERSVFTLVNGKVRPEEYIYQQKGTNSRLNMVFFDWAKGTAENLYKGQTKIIQLEDGTLDPLIYQVVLMQDLKKQQGKPLQYVEYKIANKGEIQVYRPKLVGEETIKTGIGKLKTIKYERRSSNSNRRTTFWCAPSLHYLPVQVEHIEKDGDVFRLELKSVEGL